MEINNNNINLTTLYGHSQLWDRADLDTSFFHLNLKSEFI